MGISSSFEARLHRGNGLNGLPPGSFTGASFQATTAQAAALAPHTDEPESKGRSTTATTAFSILRRSLAEENLVPLNGPSQPLQFRDATQISLSSGLRSHHAHFQQPHLRTPGNQEQLPHLLHHPQEQQQYQRQQRQLRSRQQQHDQLSSCPQHLQAAPIPDSENAPVVPRTRGKLSKRRVTKPASLSTPNLLAPNLSSSAAFQPLPTHPFYRLAPSTEAGLSSVASNVSDTSLIIQPPGPIAASPRRRLRSMSSEDRLSKGEWRSAMPFVRSNKPNDPATLKSPSISESVTSPNSSRSWFTNKRNSLEPNTTFWGGQGRHSRSADIIDPSAISSPQLSHQLSNLKPSLPRHGDTTTAPTGAITKQALFPASSLATLSTSITSSPSCSVPLSRVGSDISLHTPIRRRAIIEIPGVATRAPKCLSNCSQNHSHTPAAGSRANSISSVSCSTQSPNLATSTLIIPSISLNSFGSDSGNGVVEPDVEALPHREPDFLESNLLLACEPEAPDSDHRAATPCEAAYRQLGGIMFGSLRITNGAPLQSPHESCTREPEAPMSSECSNGVMIGMSFPPSSALIRTSTAVPIQTATSTISTSPVSMHDNDDCFDSPFDSASLRPRPLRIRRRESASPQALGSLATDFPALPIPLPPQINPTSSYDLCIASKPTAMDDLLFEDEPDGTSAVTPPSPILSPPISIPPPSPAVPLEPTSYNSINITGKPFSDNFNRSRTTLDTTAVGNPTMDVPSSMTKVSTRSHQAVAFPDNGYRRQLFPRCLSTVDDVTGSHPQSENIMVANRQSRPKSSEIPSIICPHQDHLSARRPEPTDVSRLSRAIPLISAPSLHRSRHMSTPILGNERDTMSDQCFSSDASSSRSNRQRGSASSAHSVLSDTAGSTLSIGVGSQRPNKLMRLLNGNKLRGPPVVYPIHQLDKPVPSIPADMRNKYSQRADRFPSSSPRLALRSEPSIDTLRTIFSVGSVEATSLFDLSSEIGSTTVLASSAASIISPASASLYMRSPISTVSQELDQVYLAHISIPRRPVSSLPSVSRRDSGLNEAKPIFGPAYADLKIVREQRADQALESSKAMATAAANYSILKGPEYDQTDPLHHSLRRRSLDATIAPASVSRDPGQRSVYARSTPPVSIHNRATKHLRMPRQRPLSLCTPIITSFPQDALSAYHPVSAASLPPPIPPMNPLRSTSLTDAQLGGLALEPGSKEPVGIDLGNQKRLEFPQRRSGQTPSPHQLQSMHGGIWDTNGRLQSQAARERYGIYGVPSTQSQYGIMPGFQSTLYQQNAPVMG